MLDPGLVGAQVGEGVFTWSSTDALLYALAVGADARPGDLPFTTENTAGVPQRALPTLILLPTADLPLAALGVSIEQVLHGEQHISLHAPVPVSGSLATSTVVEAVEDKGRHSAVTVVTTLRDVEEGTLVAETRNVVIVRGAGGFGGESRAPAPWERPDRDPDEIVSVPTRPEQALLYRLTGDRNPLHSDPAVAAHAGFPAPILHGLATFGITGLALLRSLCASDPAHFAGMGARFSSPVLPGETIDVHLWRIPSGAVFQALVGDRVVLERGTVSIR
jgi:acyl dehydratase